MLPRPCQDHRCFTLKKHVYTRNPGAEPNPYCQSKPDWPATSPAPGRKYTHQKLKKAEEEPMSHHGTLAHMIEAHPQTKGTPNPALEKLLTLLQECATVCTACADACLAEDNAAEMRACIRTDLDCADICAATARVVARQTATDQTVLQAVLQACAAVCQKCGSECAEHAEMMEHCKICAQTCHNCETACRELLD